MVLFFDARAAGQAAILSILGFWLTYVFGSYSDGLTTRDVVFPIVIFLYVYFKNFNRAKDVRVDTTVTGVGEEESLKSSYVCGRMSTIGTAEAPGNAVVILFWSADSKPCMNNLEFFNRTYHAYKDKGVSFVAVTQGEWEPTLAVVKAQEGKADFPVALDDGEVTKGYQVRFGVNEIPHCYVVSKQGKLVWHGHPTAADVRPSLQKALLSDTKRGKCDKKGAGGGG